MPENKQCGNFCKRREYAARKGPTPSPLP